MKNNIIIKKVICSNCDGTGGLIRYRKDGKGIEHSACDMCGGKGILLRKVTIEFVKIEDERKLYEEIESEE